MTTPEKLIALSGGCTVASVDGVKWATNGHLLVVVNEDEQEGVRGDSSVLPSTKLENSVRRYVTVPDNVGEILWDLHVYVSEFTGMAYRTGKQNGQITANEAYLRICGFGGDVQMLTVGPDSPIYAVGKGGLLSGVVMPLRSMAFDASGFLRVDDFPEWAVEQWLYWTDREEVAP